MVIEKPDKRFHFKDIVSELAFSRMLKVEWLFLRVDFLFFYQTIMTPGLLALLQESFFFFSNFTQNGPFLF